MENSEISRSGSSAILFADIAGYTALMQEDESRAMQLLRKFQQELTERVGAAQGQLANFYGDGALCTFSDAVLAVRCAMGLQSALRRSPQVPVRIGLHFGRVTHEQGNVFGHHVNVTSRIESMGIPGAILFSKAIKNKLSKEYDLQMVSMGHFQFKNVEESLEVFALANSGLSLPRRNELRGKFKATASPDEQAPKSIAVLPFESRSGDPDDALLSDGISEEIIYALSRLKQIRVAGRVSSFSFRGKHIDPQEIGQRLQVDYLLVGNILKRGDRIRVNAELLGTADGFQVWSERFNAEMQDFFQVQEDIAQALIEGIGAELLEKEQSAPLLSRQTDNVDAYQLYLRGRHYLDQRTSLDLSLSLYQKAIEIDPKYALAYSGMSYVYFYQILFDNKPPSTFIKAQEAATRAMSLDPQLGEAYIIDGIVYFYYYWNPQKALEQYQKSYELNPNYDIVRIMAYYYSMMGKPERAISLANQAVEMDPLNLGAQLGLGEILYRSNVFDKAIRVLEELLERFPGNKVAESILAAAHYHHGDMEKAGAYYANESFSPKLILFYYLPHYFFLLERGQPEKARPLVELVENQGEDKWISPASKAMLYFGLGDLDQAASLLHQALTERDPILWIIHSEPTWKAFREHPRLQAILQERFVPRG